MTSFMYSVEVSQQLLTLKVAVGSILVSVLFFLTKQTKKINKIEVSVGNSNEAPICFPL